jgi:hypothetical protein
MYVVIALIMFFLIVNFVKCSERKPEFYFNGKPCYTQSRCIESKTYTKWDLHYGYWMGKWKYHYGPHSVTECVKMKIDTIIIQRR